MDMFLSLPLVPPNFCHMEPLWRSIHDMQDYQCFVPLITCMYISQCYTAKLHAPLHIK